MTVVGLEEHNLEQQKGIDVKIGGGPRVRYIENKPTPLTYYQWKRDYRLSQAIPWKRTEELSEVTKALDRKFPPAFCDFDILLSSRSQFSLPPQTPFNIEVPGSLLRSPSPTWEVGLSLGPGRKQGEH